MRAVLALVAVTTVLLGAPGAARAGTFAHPLTLSAAGQSAYAPYAALNSRGDALIVWLASDGEHSWVQYVELLAGGSAGQPQTLSSTDGRVSGAQVAVGDHGDAVITWCQSTADGADFVASVRRGTNAFGEPQTLSPPGVEAFDCDRPSWGLPQAAFGPAGDVTAVWTVVPTGSPDPYLAEQRVQIATMPEAGTSFSPARYISPAGQSSRHPQLAIDSGGVATVVWRAARQGEYFHIDAITRPSGGDFGAPETISAPTSHSELERIAVGPAGEAVVAWRQVRLYGEAVSVAFRPPGGSFGPVQDLTRPEVDPNYAEPVHFGGPARVAIGRNGDAVAVWSESHEARDTKEVYAAIRPAAADRFGPPEELSYPFHKAGAARIAVDGEGNFVAVWRARATHTTNKFQICAAIRPHGGRFGDELRMSPDGRNAFAPQVVLAPNGDGVVVWRQFDGSNWRIKYSTYTAIDSPPTNNSEVLVAK